MKIFVFDVETQSLPLWDQPSLDPRQPHLVQFVGLLFDDQTGDELDYYAELIAPDGWTIPDEVVKLHGITTEMAAESGVPEVMAARYYYRMCLGADRIVGFSVDFDIRLMRIAMKRAAIPEEKLTAFADMVKSKKYDVKPKCTPICRLPPTPKMMAAGRKSFKDPTLAEAVKGVLKEDMADAHDARADVVATQRLYVHLNPVTA
jgi:DNA polymerase III subunit epsilon